MLVRPERTDSRFTAWPSPCDVTIPRPVTATRLRIRRPSGVAPCLGRQVREGSQVEPAEKRGRDRGKRERSGPTRQGHEEEEPGKRQRGGRDGCRQGQEVTAVSHPVLRLPGP